MQLLNGPNGSTRLLWHTDVLPDVADVIRGLVDEGMLAIERTLGVP